VAVLYAGGVLLGNYLPFPLPCLLAMTGAATAAALLLPRLRQYFIWLLFLFLGWTNFTWHTAITSPTDLRVLLNEKPTLATVHGTLAETPTERIYLEDGVESIRTMARLKVTSLQRGPTTQPASGQIEIITSGLPSENFYRGQQVQIYGVLSAPPPPLAEGLFDYRTYLRRQEIYFELKAGSNDWQSVGNKISPSLNDRFSRWAKTALALGRPEMDSSLHLEQSLTLGEKTFLTDDLTEPFVRASTYHIFAVDGLRMAILFGIFFQALRWLRVPRTPRGLLLIPLIWFYVDLTGWPASAIRAAVMLTIVIIGWLLKRPSNVLNSLFAAAFIILLWQPQQLFQAGFQLSFFVVLCILLVMPIFDSFVQRILRSDPLLPDELRPRWQRILSPPSRWLLGLAFSSLAAWIGSIPLVAYYFHIITPISTLANIVAVPLCMLVLTCNSASLLLAGWLPAGAVIFNYFGWLFMKWIHSTSIWFAGWPHAYSYVAAPTVFSIMFYYALLLALVTGWLFQIKWRKWKLIALILLLTIWSAQRLHDRSTTRLTILPLNGGSAIYCDAPGVKNDLLINCGNEDAVEFVMKPYLRAQGVNALPRLALTHGAAQQIAGFEKLQTLFPIEKVVTSTAQFRSPAYRNILRLLDPTPGRRKVVNCGDAFDNWIVLHPAETNHFTRAEDNALVLSGEILDTGVLLLSDLGSAGQQELLARNTDLRADIVVAGLPDQGEPLNDAMLAASHPQLIIIADSKSPATRRASRVLRERLEKHGVPVLFTSELGAVKISLRKNQWKVETVDGPSWSGAPKL